VQSSSSTLNNLAALTNKLRDLLVLVWQQAQGIGDVVPLPFVLSPRQSGSQLAGQLFGMLVLRIWLVNVDLRRG